MTSIESIILLAKPWAIKIIEEKFLPYLYNKGYQYYEKSIKAHRVRSTMSDYLSKTKAQCSTINSLAFPNVLKKINDIYEPLVLASMDSREERTYKITHGELFLKNHTHVLIIDNAGMGKSTLIKKIVIDTIERTDLIPVYIELRSLSDTPIIEQVKSLLGLSPDDPDDLIEEFPFAYFFDGVDEIPFDQKNAIIKRIRFFSENFNNSKVIISSRPDHSLLELHGYARFRIKPLDLEQSYNLLTLYDSNSFNIGDSLVLSKKLISEIECMKNKESILEFLTTPLYVSLLFCSYKYKPVIPRRKDLFYSQVFEALFETHDLSKETGYVRKKNSGLDITEFSILLRRLAFWCLKNNGRLEFTRSELEDCILDITSRLKGVNVRPSLFISDLTYSVPLFIKEGSLYRWSHKSLMEYFSAEFICIEVKEQREDILLKLYESNSAIKYKNILELCSDIDYSSFRKSVLKQCLNEYLEHIMNLNVDLLVGGSDKEIWSSMSFFTNISIMLTPYGSMNLGDFQRNAEEQFDESLTTFESTFIGFRDYITHLTYPVTLRSTVFDILRWRNGDYFYKERDFYERMRDEDHLIPENKVIECVNGEVVNFKNDIIPGVISVLLQFRHALPIPVIKTRYAEHVLNDIENDNSNGINSLLEGF